jgi:hypothetical protein
VESTLESSRILQVRTPFVTYQISGFPQSWAMEGWAQDIFFSCLTCFVDQGLQPKNASILMCGCKREKNTQ